MKLKCEHAPALGGAMVSGGWQAAPAILGCGEFLVHDISRGTSCSSMLYMKARAHLTAPRTQITLSSVHNRSNGGERWKEPRLPPSPRVPAREESAEWWSFEKVTKCSFSSFHLWKSLSNCLTSRSWVSLSLFLWFLPWLSYFPYICGAIFWSPFLSPTCFSTCLCLCIPVFFFQSLWFSHSLTLSPFLCFSLPLCGPLSASLFLAIPLFSPSFPFLPSLSHSSLFSHLLLLS